MKEFWQKVRFPILCFLIAMALALLGVMADHLFASILLSGFFWCAAAVPFAIAFYRLRGRNRLVYGAFELVIGFAALYVGLLNIMRSGQLISFERVATTMLVIFVALYFMVRALDNIGGGLKPGSKAEARWLVLFPKAT